METDTETKQRGRNRGVKQTENANKKSWAEQQREVEENEKKDF